MKFYRDILSGPLYLLSLIFIMAIIGFIIERKNQEKEEKGRVAYVNNSSDVPMEPVETKTEVTPVPVPVQTELNNVNNETVPQKQDSNPSLLVKTPVVVFDDPDKKE